MVVFFNRYDPEKIRQFILSKANVSWSFKLLKVSIKSGTADITGIEFIPQIPDIDELKRNIVIEILTKHELLLYLNYLGYDIKDDHNYKKDLYGEIPGIVTDIDYHIPFNWLFSIPEEIIYMAKIANNKDINTRFFKPIFQMMYQLYFDTNRNFGSKRMTGYEEDNTILDSIVRMLLSFDEDSVDPKQQPKPVVFI